MNEITIAVDFANGTVVRKGINLITGDYKTTKLVFTFEADYSSGTLTFEMLNPSGELCLLQNITNNEIVLVGEDEEGEECSLFSEEGRYPFEISLYKGGGKLTSAQGSLMVSAEAVEVSDEVAEPYLPLFDNLMTEVENIDISSEKVGSTATVSVTDRSGETSTFTITDGEDGADAKINGVNTLTISAGQNISITQSGSNMTISATGGSGGTSDHTQLSNRDSANQHPISAITNLQTSLDAKADTEDIPTKTSQLTNDSGFLTEHQSLSAYRTASAQDIIDTNITSSIASAVSTHNASADAHSTLFSAKQDTLTAGTNIAITDNTIDVGSNVAISNTTATTYTNEVVLFNGTGAKLKRSYNSLDSFQHKYDADLNTSSKYVVSAINELDTELTSATTWYKHTIQISGSAKSGAKFTLVNNRSSAYNLLSEMSNYGSPICIPCTATGYHGLISTLSATGIITWISTTDGTVTVETLNMPVVSDTVTTVTW